MLAVRCGGGCGGAGAYLTAQRTTAARSGDGRSAVLSAGTGARGRSLRVSFSPNSRPHRVGASCPWPLRCSSGPSPERRVSKKKRDEAWEALKTEFGRMFRPQLRNLGEIFSLRSVYDLEDYQIGMLFGAFLGCVGCYQLWKTAPSIFVDAILAFIFYKLSVVSSELHRSHKSNSLITRLKFGTILIMVWKDIKKNYVLLDVISHNLFSSTMTIPHPCRRLGADNQLRHVRDWAPLGWHWERLPSGARSLVRNPGLIVDPELLWWWSRGPLSVRREPAPAVVVRHRVREEDEHVRRYMIALDVRFSNTWQVLQGSHPSYDHVMVASLWVSTARTSGTASQLDYSIIFELY